MRKYIVILSFATRLPPPHLYYILACIVVTLGHSRDGIDTMPVWNGESNVPSDASYIYILHNTTSIYRVQHRGHANPFQVYTTARHLDIKFFLGYCTYTNA